MFQHPDELLNNYSPNLQNQELYPAKYNLEQNQQLFYATTDILQHNQEFYAAKEIQEYSKINSRSPFLHQVAEKRIPVSAQKRLRTAFTDCQLTVLKHEFEEHQYACRPKRIELSNKLGLSESQIKIWFQNRRMKFKNNTREGKNLKKPVRRPSSAMESDQLSLSPKPIQSIVKNKSHAKIVNRLMVHSPYAKFSNNNTVNVTLPVKLQYQPTSNSNGYHYKGKNSRNAKIMNEPLARPSSAMHNIQKTSSPKSIQSILQNNIQDIGHVNIVNRKMAYSPYTNSTLPVQHQSHYTFYSKDCQYYGETSPTYVAYTYIQPVENCDTYNCCNNYVENDCNQFCPVNGDFDYTENDCQLNEFKGRAENKQVSKNIQSELVNKMKDTEINNNTINNVNLSTNNNSALVRMGALSESLENLKLDPFEDAEPYNEMALLNEVARTATVDGEFLWELINRAQSDSYFGD